MSDIIIHTVLRRQRWKTGVVAGKLPTLESTLQLYFGVPKSQHCFQRHFGVLCSHYKSQTPYVTNSLCHKLTIDIKTGAEIVYTRSICILVRKIYRQSRLAIFFTVISATRARTESLALPSV
jgi:hypothetical protein